MRKSILVILLFLFSLNIFAQKAVRDSIRAGNKAYNEQMYNASENNYKAALNINPAEKIAIYNLGNAYYRQGKWDEAIKQYENYIALEKDDIGKASKALHNMGNAYLKKKDLQKSMIAYKDALRLNSTDDETRYNLAVVQKMLKDQNDKKQDKDQDKDQSQDKDKQQEQNKDQDKNNEQENKQPKQQQESQMSRENVEQILKAMEQEEKATQERVNQAKIEAQKEKNATNKRQDKDW